MGRARGSSSSDISAPPSKGECLPGLATRRLSERDPPMCQGGGPCDAIATRSSRQPVIQTERRCWRDQLQLACPGSSLAHSNRTALLARSTSARLSRKLARSGSTDAELPRAFGTTTRPCQHRCSRTLSSMAACTDGSVASLGGPFGGLNRDASSGERGGAARARSPCTPPAVIRSTRVVHLWGIRGRGGGGGGPLGSSSQTFSIHPQALPTCTHISSDPLDTPHPPTGLF